MSDKKAMSPLIATVILVVFALTIGIITMSYGKDYVNRLQTDDQSSEPVVIPASMINTDLKSLQLEYIQGKITLDLYLEREESLIGRKP